jgi:hypothetical protein
MRHAQAQQRGSEGGLAALFKPPITPSSSPARVRPAMQERGQRAEGGQAKRKRQLGGAKRAIKQPTKQADGEAGGFRAGPS